MKFYRPYVFRLKNIHNLYTDNQFIRQCDQISFTKSHFILRICMIISLKINFKNGMDSVC